MSENINNKLLPPGPGFEAALGREVEAAFADTGLPAARIDMLVAYGVRLAEASTQVNLTRILEPKKMAIGHFLDAYHLLPLLKNVEGRVLDMGTGGGVPGLVLAILRRDLKVVLMDCTGKKIKFIQECIEELKIKNATAVHARVEEHLHRQRYAVAVTRAAIKPAALMEHLVLTGPCLGRIIFMEGSRGKIKTQQHPLSKIIRQFG